MPLPDDASIEQLAEVFGVSPANLTPAARRLTKGDLVQLYGVNDAVAASRVYFDRGQVIPEEAVPRARQAGLNLSVEDISSIERVFGSPTIPVSYMQQFRNAERQLAVGETVNVYIVLACCCPCCCATAVIKPSRHAVD